jgi:TonB-linked SusC/RagA family outer membrane protein
MAGTERRKGNNDYFSAFRRYYASTAIPQLFAGGTSEINNDGSGSVNARMSYFGRVNYDYKSKYLLEFVWRYDGSYIFPESKRFGFFPAISAGWRISDESFWQQNLSFINNFKLRASWGQTGNDRIPEWTYLGTYAYGSWLYLDPNDPAFLPFVTNGTIENLGLYETRVPNPNATWEVVNQTDIGFDAAFLDNRLSVEFDYFSYKRGQILWKNTGVVPASAGLELPYENYGKVNNRGFDFMVTWKDRAGDFIYSVSVNGGHQKNKILLWNERDNKPSYQSAIGKPMPTDPDPNNPDKGEYYQAIGIFRTADDLNKYPHIDGAMAGDIIFEDVNADGKIDDLDKVRSSKSNIPTFTGGLNINLQYKGFDLSLLVQGATGAENYINTESGEIGNFLESFAKNRWTPTNTGASGPRTFNRSNEYWVSRQNTHFLLKTDYVRLKTLQIGYTIPAKINTRIGIQNLRVYVSGYNLLTYTPEYKDFDPELTQGSGQGYPLQKVLSAGVSLTF